MKYSRQRELILDAVREDAVHPTADMIYQKLKKEHPNLSLGTVYRNLNLLSEIGTINKLHVPGMPDRFDGNITPHYHFYCKRCGGVFDLPLSYLGNIDEQVRKETECQVDFHNILFRGTCKECAKITAHVSSGGHTVE
ncbi:Fur family transcriptional regulator [Zongyangia hominis]|uniref:Transcriptional repressor n=1 Tax=Zongyangia hominis TaxID=2763677 RepID=A0A926IBQ8_9FIRM|nr:transcriptional repressor [Zongyangia hominis]MBC8570345.1 transcriptional repressor [Zongyangia hominis]